MVKALKTTRCTLKPLSKLDFEDVKTLYSDATTRKFLGGVLVSVAFEDKFESLLNEEDSQHWIVREISKGGLIGLVSLSNHHNKEDVEISYQLLSNQFNKGYALEVVKAMLDYSFLDLKLKRVLAETQSKNMKSIRLLEKLGFCLDSRLVRFGEEQSIYILQSNK